MKLQFARSLERKVSEAADLAAAAGDGVEDKPGEEAQHRDDRYSGDEDGRRDSRDETGVQISDDQRDREDDRGGEKQSSDPAVEEHRALDPVERRNRLQDAPAV